MKGAGTSLSVFCCLACLVFANCFGELVGAGRIASTTDTGQEGFDFVDILSFNEACDALQVAAATADKTNVVHFVVFVNVEEDLSGAGAFCGVCEHSFLPHFNVLMWLQIYFATLFL